MSVAACGMVCHSKCAEKLPKSCTGSRNGGVDLDGPMRMSFSSTGVYALVGIWLIGSAPSMFGRELAEQAANDRLAVPVIVSKSISAVEAVGAFLYLCGYCCLRY